MTLQPGHRYVSQPPPAPHPQPSSPSLVAKSAKCKLPAGLETPCAPKRLLVLEGKRGYNNLALELHRENEGMRRSGPPDPHKFQGGKCSIKMHFCRGSAAASQQSHHCLRLHCRCPQPGERLRNRLSSWNRNAGSWPSGWHQKRRSVYPRCPYLKTKQKAPLHPQPFSIQDTGEGQGMVGGHSICWHVRRACQKIPNEPARLGKKGHPQAAGKVLWNI